MLAVGFSFWCSANSNAQEQAPAAEFEQVSTAELEKQAQLHGGAQKYDAAVPLLTELVTRLGESHTLPVAIQGTRVPLFSGPGLVFTDQWDAAAQVFEIFLKAHPKSNRYRKVLELHGDTLVQSKRYPEAAEQYNKLLEMKLSETEIFPIMEKLASCYMRDQNGPRRSQSCKRCCRRVGLRSSGANGRLACAILY